MIDKHLMEQIEAEMPKIPLADQPSREQWHKYYEDVEAQKEEMAARYEEKCRLRRIAAVEKEHKRQLHGKSLKTLLIEELSQHDETWEDVLYTTLKTTQLEEKYLDNEGIAHPFLLWTENRVYTVTTNDCDDTWIVSLPRNIQMNDEGFI